MSKVNRSTALITGASTGIGLATTRALRDAGFRVFGTSRRASARGADGITMLRCDVTDHTSVAELVSDVVDQSGHIDVLVNNAGIGLFAAAEESSIEQARALFDINVFGVLRVTTRSCPSCGVRAMAGSST